MNVSVDHTHTYPRTPLHTLSLGHVADGAVTGAKRKKRQLVEVYMTWLCGDQCLRQPERSYGHKVRSISDTTTIMEESKVVGGENMTYSVNPIYLAVHK